MKSIIITLMILILSVLVWVVKSQELLNNVAITFSLSGTANYIPTSGGIAIRGYTFTLGFDRYSWLGIQFQTLTTSNNYDTLILQRSASPSNGVYTCSISDYYVSSGRPTVLMTDTITSMDQVGTSNSDSSIYILTIPRTLGSTNGEDWQGGEFTTICFFTSDTAFSQSTWTKQYQACYGYEINNYVSTYRGSPLGSMMFEGVTSQMYGGIYGPYLQMKLFWYRNSPTIANNSIIVIQLGSEISSALGNDYHACGYGDYYGYSTSNLMQDLIYSGYSNGACTFRTTNMSSMMTLTRDVYTYDDFDVTITQSLNVCVIGLQTNCAVIILPLNYPIMDVASALTIHQHFLSVRFILLLSVLLFGMI